MKTILAALIGLALGSGLLLAAARLLNDTAIR